MRARAAALVIATSLAAACGSKPRCEPGVTRAVVPTATPRQAGSTNGTFYSNLASRALNAESLSRDKGYLEALASSENERVSLQHLVECALAADVKFTLELASGPLLLEGIAGYGAEWATGPCDEACQEWVTACNIARVNYYGIPVRIFLRSQKGIDAEPPSAEALRLFSVEEGAFYGNMFTFPSRVYACRGRGFDPLYMTFRVCSDGEFPCGLVVPGPCSREVDGATGQPSDRWACEGFDAPSGTYYGCHGGTTTDGTFPEGKVFSRVVTVSVRSSSFSRQGTETRCE